MATRHFRDQIGGCRRHDNKVGIAGKPNVADIEFALWIEQIGIGAFSGQRADGQWRNEMLRGSGENATDVRAAVLQTADQIERFIGGNAATYNEQDALAAGFGNWWPLLRRLRTGLETFEDIAAGVVGGCSQDGPHLVFHRAAVARRAQPQQCLQFVVELADGEAGHWYFLMQDQDITARLIAVQSLQSMFNREPQ